jgi:C4-dicarboxylate-specific signal transduction histidine kinase
MPGGGGEWQRRIERANRAVTMGRLSASIAHEVNQPLSGIITNASTCLRLLAADSPDIAGAAETARRMIRDAERASDIIRRLRALFSKAKIASELVDLNEVSREAISLSLRELQSGRVILQLEFADGLPFVEGDRLQLQEVLLNLIRNASDAMSSIEDRPRQLAIRTAKAEPDSVLVAVQDSGPGPDPAYLERLFDAFFTTKPGGLGMGLAVCRTIIEAHGGKLWATIAVPHGAIFQFSLPAEAGEPRRSSAHSTNRREK